MSATVPMIQLAYPSSVLDPAILERDNALIDRLDAAIRATLPCLDIEHDIPPIHHFADGLYARTMVVPAGMLLVGLVHRSSHISVLSQGDISVWSVGGGVQHYSAPHIIVAPAGTRRIGFTRTPVVWTTFHATDATDVESAEEKLLEKRPEVQHTAEDVRELERVLEQFGLHSQLPAVADDDERTMSLDGGTE